MRIISTRFFILVSLKHFVFSWIISVWYLNAFDISISWIRKWNIRKINSKKKIETEQKLTISTIFRVPQIFLRRNVSKKSRERALMMKNTGDILRNFASHIPQYLKKVMLLIQYKIKLLEKCKLKICAYIL